MIELEEVSRDPRGWIKRVVKPNGREVIFIYTKKGYARGGEYHDSLQFDFVLFGTIRWTMRKDGKEWVYDQTSAEPYGYITPGQAHLAEALEDTLYVEWISGPFEKTFVPDMRKIVEERMKNGPV